MFSRAVAYGNMLFLAGVGYHQPGTIEDHTKGVLDEIKKNLEDAGSSLQKCLKVSVFLADLKDYERMNAVYRSYDWGSPPPVRTTTAAAGVPGNSLVEIDVVAYLIAEWNWTVRWRRDLSPGMAAGAMTPIAIRAGGGGNRHRRIISSPIGDRSSMPAAPTPSSAARVPCRSQAGHVRGLALLRPDGRDDGRRRQGTGAAERL
jgi:enamine deaminase RidA (YjgF/YER057c/UK114 family)